MRFQRQGLYPEMKRVKANLVQNRQLPNWENKDVLEAALLNTDQVALPFA